MSPYALSFASGLDALSVRHFSIREALSSLFEVDVTAVSPLDDLDVESLLGHGASFTIHGDAGAPVHGFTGVCSHVEQQQVEASGLSTYLVRIVPDLWLLTQRRDHRIFQHRSIPSIVRDVLAHYRIHPTLALDAGSHPAHDYRTQYGETDFAFVSRLLEEAGISYRFAFDPAKGTALVLDDEPQRRDHRHGGLLPFVGEPGPGPHAPFVTQVASARELRPGAYTVRDFDFRARLDVDLTGEARHDHAIEATLEQYHYHPGAMHRAEEHVAGDAHRAAIAGRGLDAERSLAQIITYRTNVLDLAPGAVFSIGGHPRARIAAPHRLLVVEQRIEGGEGEDVHISGCAVPAALPHRPARATRRPRISGVQSAIVTGPAGEEIHTDAHGRVRVKFPWDRAEGRDDRSSRWVRVSQGWAGAGFGMMMLPRVGQEVLVGFFEGDPDQPVIVGRVFDTQNHVPYALPEHKTRSTWKGASTPGGGDGPSNEIVLEDARGKELVAIHAARDLHTSAKRDQVETTARDRTITVGRNRAATVGGVDSTVVGKRHEVLIASPGEAAGTSLSLADRRIVLTTGEASVTFDGGDLALEAKGNITIIAREGDVVIKGGPNVKINCD